MMKMSSTSLKDVFLVSYSVDVLQYTASFLQMKSVSLIVASAFSLALLTALTSCASGSPGKHDLYDAGGYCISATVSSCWLRMRSVSLVVMFVSGLLKSCMWLHDKYSICIRKRHHVFGFVCWLSTVHLDSVDRAWTDVHACPALTSLFGRCNQTQCSKSSFPLAGRTEKLEECLLSDQSPLSSGVDSGQQSPVSPENRKTHRGIKKLWGK